MTNGDKRVIRERIQEFAKRSTPIALSIFLFDVSLYVGAIFGVIYFEQIHLKIACSSIAATMISALFVVGHDAAHGAFTSSKPLNDFIGRVVFLPSLHNYSLWQVVHNKLHHGSPNLKDLNSWSPMSLEEYKSLPPWRKLLERIYRTPIGFGPYYFVERWWKHKFYPWDKNNRRPTYLRDFALLISFLVTLLGTVTLGTKLSEHSSVIMNIFFAVLLPFTVWNFSMGWTVYIQHTHERIPWFENKLQWERGYDYGEFTPYIKFPRWFGFIFHDINEHTAHHLAPKIPCYRLFRAQRLVEKELGEEIVAERFSIIKLVKRMGACKLYDFKKHQWTDFNGTPTTRPVVVSADIPVRVVRNSTKEILLSELLASESTGSAEINYREMAVG